MIIGENALAVKSSGYRDTELFREAL